MSGHAAPAADLHARLRLSPAVVPTGVAALITAATVNAAEHTTWAWVALSCLLLAGICYVHVARLHTYLRGHAAHDIRQPLLVLWWWHFAALVFTGCAFPATIGWLFANGPVEIVTANLTMIILVFSVRASWKALTATHHGLIDLQQL